MARRPSNTKVQQLLVLVATVGCLGVGTDTYAQCPNACCHTGVIRAGGGPPPPDTGGALQLWHESYPPDGAPMNEGGLGTIEFFFNPQRVGTFTFKAIASVGYRDSPWVPGAYCPPPPNQDFPPCHFCTASFDITLHVGFQDLGPRPFQKLVPPVPSA